MLVWFPTDFFIFFLSWKKKNPSGQPESFLFVCPQDLAQVVKGWGGFVGGFKFKSQWGQKIYLSKKKKSKSFLFVFFLSLLLK